MKVRVDATLCDAFGKCALIAGEVFELDDWGYAQAVADGSVPEHLKPAASRAVAECPLHAIVVVEP